MSGAPANLSPALIGRHRAFAGLAELNELGVEKA